MSESSRPEWYGDLAEGPILQSAPTRSQIQQMIERSIRPKPMRRRIRISIALATAAIITLLIVSGIYGYVNDRRNDIRQAAIPGSAEWVKVQHAVEKFRRYQPGQIHVQYVAPVSDGVLIFYQRFFAEKGTDMSVEYMRRTFHGWKWIHGGGSGGSYTENKNYLFGEYIPSPNTFLHTHTPFPILYGTIVGEATKVVIIGQQNFRIEATVFPSEGQLGWFAYLPESAGKKFIMQGVDSDGRIIQEKPINTDDYKPGSSKSSAGSERIDK